MRGSRTLAWSLAREISQYTLVGFAAASVVLVSQNLLRRMDELTAVGFRLADFGVVLGCLFPMLTVYTIPVALLFGTALAIRRRVSDSEVLAMRACGLGVGTLAVPAIAIGALVTGVSAWLLIAVEHQARRELIELLNSVAARGSILRAGDFRGIDNRVIYVAERHRNNHLEGVMISDQSQDPPFLIFAEEGRLDLDEESAQIHLQLGEGEMHIAPGELETDRYRRVLFRKFDYSFDVTALLSGDFRPVRPKQMTLAELRSVVARGQTGDPLQELKKKDPILYQLEIQRRFALPLAPLLFAIAAVPLALMGQRSSRAWGPIACVVLAFSFYALLTLMQYLAKEGWLPPLVAFWAPNLLLLAVSLELLRRTELGVSR
jgi:lipopolysaccharide export system permease protein